MIGTELDSTESNQKPGSVCLKSCKEVQVDFVLLPVHKKAAERLKERVSQSFFIAKAFDEGH
jgi:hypothetical protein